MATVNLLGLYKMSKYKCTLLRLLARHTILPSGSLQIHSASVSDQGVYQCLATNALTRQTKKANNKIQLLVSSMY